jgi:hypothetical protein
MDTLRNSMLVTKAGKGIWNIEKITNADCRALVKALDFYYEKVIVPRYGENAPLDPLNELRADLEEESALWESAREHERQTVRDAEERVKQKKKGAAGK